MLESAVLEHLLQTGALMRGHFLLRSGLHSDRYFQAALLLQNTGVAAAFGAAMAARWQGQSIDTVISPAVGGIVIGQEVGRSLQTKAIFAEKDDQSELLLRRGFTLSPGERVLIAEDVITKGGRVAQTVALVRAHGAIPVGIAVMVDRSDGTIDFGVPYHSLIKLDLPTYAPEQCPLCQQGLPIDQPGSK